MDILFVMPYPPSRIRVRGYSFIQHLRQEHAVTILTQVSSTQEWRDVELLRQQGYEVVPVPVSRPQALMRCGAAMFTSLPLQVAYSRSKDFLCRARELCSQRHFDIIHVEHLRGIASLLEFAGEYPLVWDAVDCISRLWKQTAVLGANLPTRMLAALEYRRTTRYERLLTQKCDHITLVSQADRDALAALAPHSSGHAHALPAAITVIPNGVDLDYFVPTQQSYRPYNIVFSGKMSYHANVSAALHLYSCIMPLVWREMPQTTLTLVGSKPPEVVQRLSADPRVVVTGYVDDIRPYVRSAHVMVCPMLYSAGVQNKVLEAMALGVPAVVSAQSAAALEARPGEDLLIARSPQEFADQLLRVMRDEQLRASLSRQGRAYVESHHDWRVVTARLVQYYQSAIATDLHTVPVGSTRAKTWSS